MPILTPALLAGFKAGLAAPIALYAPTPTYAVPAHVFGPAHAFAMVGALLSSSLPEDRQG
jgi:hypothetical protein